MATWGTLLPACGSTSAKGIERVRSSRSARALQGHPSRMAIVTLGAAAALLAPGGLPCRPLRAGPPAATTTAPGG